MLAWVITAQLPSSILGGGIPNQSWGTLKGVISNIAGILIYLAGAVAIIYLIIGGYKYVFSFGNPEAAEHAKNTMTWAIIGLVLVLSAVLIINQIGGLVQPFG